MNTKEFLDDVLAEARKLTKDTRPSEEKFDAAMENLDTPTPTWKDLSHEEKCSRCTHQSGAYAVIRLPGQKASYQPMYCGHCPLCLASQAEARKKKFAQAEMIAKVEKPDGHWCKKKLPVEGPERESYKRQVARKHDSMHMEIPCTAEEAVEVWTWTDSSDDQMGEPADPAEIDWDAINKKCKNGNSRVSFGGGIRPKPKPVKENTERLVIPQIIVSRRDVPKTVEIVNQVNVLEEAEDFAEVQNLMLRRFALAVEALKMAGIDIIAVGDLYRNLETEKTVKEWNAEVVSLSVIGNKSKDNKQTKPLSEMEIFYREMIYPGFSVA